MTMPSAKLLRADETRPARKALAFGSTVKRGKLSPDEFWVLTTPGIAESVTKGITDAKMGRLVDLGDFSQFADIDDD